MLRPFITGELWQGKGVMSLDHPDPNCDRRVKRESDRHGDFGQAHGSPPKSCPKHTASSSGKKGKMESWNKHVLSLSCPTRATQRLAHAEEQAWDSVHIALVDTCCTNYYIFYIYKFFLQFSIVHSAFWMNQRSRGKSIFHLHPHK